jgi:hypothetical protein
MQTAAKAGELAAASAEVIGRRLADVARVGSVDPTEATLMVTEKAEAFALAGLAVAPHMASAGLAAARHATDETSRAVEHARSLAGATPPEAAALTARYWFDAWGRGAAFWAVLGAAGTAAAAAALAPVHKTAVANRRRLRR